MTTMKDNGICPKEHNFHWWGEIIVGSKSYIQSYGIGLNMKFPGEVGGAKRKVTVQDPRGFKSSISIDYFDKSAYRCEITYPNRHINRQRIVKHSKGVTKEIGYWVDRYVGTPEDLINSKIIDGNYLPGEDGMPKRTIAFDSSGNIYTGHPNATKGTEFRKTGAKIIQKSNKKGKLEVSVYISKEEAELRIKLYHLDEALQLFKMERMPKPRKLTRMAPFSLVVSRGEFSERQIKRTNRCKPKLELVSH